MIPQTRTDLFLAKITGEDVELPVPQTRFEIYLANIAGESYELPVPNSRATLYLAKILGQDVELPEPQTRSELYLASIAGMSVQLPEAPQTREEWYLARWAEDAGYVVITGNPVSFQAVAAALRQLKVAFAPVQDLHGYANPWPAGSGANKMPPLVAGTYTSEQGLTCVVSEDGTIEITGTATSGGQAFAIPFAEPLILKSGMYVHQNSTGSSGVYDVIRFKTNADGTGDQSSWGAYPGYAGDANKAVPDADNDKEYNCLFYYINTQNTERNIILRPSIDYTATAPTAWTPYSNECPISGWTGVNVWDDPYYAGLIKWNQLMEIPESSATASLNGIDIVDNRDGSFSVSGTATADVSFLRVSKAPLPAYAGHIYCALGCPNGGSASTFWWQTANAIIDTGNGIIYDRGSFPTNSWYATINIKAGTSIATPIVFRPQYFDLTEMFGAGNEPATVKEFRAIFPKDYYAYDAGTETTAGAVNGEPGWHVPVIFPDGETYYSGWVDPTTGDGLVTVASRTLAGDSTDGNYSRIASGRFNIDNFPINFLRDESATDSGRSSRYKSVAQTATNGLFDTAASAYACAFNTSLNKSGNTLRIKDTRFDTLEELQAAYATEKPQFVLALAEPIPFHVDPQQINSLAGPNTMWSDANGDLTVEYWKDGNVSDAEALSLLLGGRYTPATGPEDVPDREALRIITGR